MRFLLFVTLASMISLGIQHSIRTADRVVTRQRSTATMIQEFATERSNGGECQWNDPGDRSAGYRCSYPVEANAALADLMASSPYRRR
jgi:hypothetical protein